jgi:hypothetical protein
MLSNTKLDTHLNKTGNLSRNQNHLTMLIHNLHQHASIVEENTNTTKQNAPLLGRSVGNVEYPIILKACANQVTRQDHVNKEYELYPMTKTMITLKYTQ